MKLMEGYAHGTKVDPYGYDYITVYRCRVVGSLLILGLYGGFPELMYDGGYPLVYDKSEVMYV